jgi:hypothetical protein
VPHLVLSPAVAGRVWHRSARLRAGARAGAEPPVIVVRFESGQDGEVDLRVELEDSSAEERRKP